MNHASIKGFEMTDCLPASNHKTRLPSMKEAVDFVSSCIDRREQMRQLQHIEQTQGREMAEQVLAKMKAAGGVKKK